MSEVATTKLLENDKVIVWEMLLEPGESTGMHTHKHSYVIQVLEGAKLSATYETSSESSDFELVTDATYWVDVRDGAAILDGVSIPASHDAKNIGDTRYREILVEIK